MAPRRSRRRVSTFCGLKLITPNTSYTYTKIKTEICN